MYALDFEYANRRLSDFGCIICQINNNKSGVEEVETGCDITFNTVKNNHSSIQSVISTTYEQVFTTTFEIMKDPCNSTINDIYFTSAELNQLVAWLSRNEYRRFKPLSIDEDLDVHYYGSFNVKRINIGNRTVGLSLTFNANAPYGFGEKIVRKYNKDDFGKFYTNPGISYLHTFKYNFGQYEESVIYPTIKLNYIGSDNQSDFYNDFTIYKNSIKEPIFNISNCVIGETITIDCANKVIYTDNGEHQKTLYNDFDYGYLRLENGENYFLLTRYYDITIEYEPIRKVGVF